MKGKIIGTIDDWKLKVNKDVKGKEIIINPDLAELFYWQVSMFKKHK